MSKNTNRAELNKAQTSKEYKCILNNDLYPIYWDEGLNFYPRYNRGYKNTNKQILMHQVRMYKTWKHTRNKQYYQR